MSSSVLGRPRPSPCRSIARHERCCPHHNLLLSTASSFAARAHQHRRQAYQREQQHEQLPIPDSKSRAALAAAAAAVATATIAVAAPALAADAVATADALATATTAATTTTSGYVPSPLQVPEWQIWVGAAAGTFPFVIGAYEFTKRILIQRRCKTCGGSGLVMRGPPGKQLQRKCLECGGFFPWRGWSEFFSATAQPGNGGPLLAPRGQTSVFYSVPPPPPPSAPLKEAVDAAIAARGGGSSSSASSSAAGEAVEQQRPNQQQQDQAP